uniref:Fibronectin type-III domain-containing protein n=1 Tax=Pygocentrus nattereri TaxID=42514 RepID=A0AAR2L2W5_PYGNA
GWSVHTTHTSAPLPQSVSCIPHILPPPLFHSMILVQVNPGETFTIRTEDGHFQCITGPAQVPMVSPNGTMPPIFVPPGYVSQVVEENGMRKVLVLPHAMEFHPSLPPVPPHLPLYASPHPAMLHHPHVFPTELPHYVHQLPALPVYSEQGEREHLHYIYIYGIWLTLLSRATYSFIILHRQAKVVLGVLPKDSYWCSVGFLPKHYMHGGRSETSCALLRQVRLTLTFPDLPCRFVGPVCECSCSAADCGFTVLTLGFECGRVCVACSSVKGAPSETVAFTTLCGTPDAPAAPRLIQRTKSSISLQWTSPNDNGSKITGFYLEYHEGKQSAFKEVYSGLAKQYKVMRLMPSTKYAFRLAAKNDVGMSAFSAVLSCCTASCSASPPAPPSPPRLTEAGVTWLSLEWGAPCGSASRDTPTYILEMEDKESDCGFQLKHRGEEQSCTVKELRRFTSYQFRVLVAGSEGTSQPSSAVEYRTQPAQPGSPGKPSLRCPAEPHSLHVIWGKLRLTDTRLNYEWEAVYSGSLRQHVCEGLQEGTWYKLRVHCQSSGGQSQVSEIFSVETPPLPPGPCQALRTAGAAATSEIPLCWDPPVCDGGAPVSQYCVEMTQSAEEYQQQVFCGSDRCCTVSQLLPGRTYLFWVKACNPAGWGPLSEMCQASTAPGPPEQCSAPQLILNTSTSGLATWQTPEGNGAEVCAFRMEWGLQEGALELLYSGPLTQYEVSDLQPATEYRCRVQAVSAVGAGLFSDVATVTTPASVPAAVEHVEEMREGPLGDVMAHSPATTLALRWKEPNCHGAEISSYNIDIGEELPLSTGRTSYHILENLQPDTTYRIRVQAVNSMGAGPFSSVLKLRTRALPPEPPVLECAVAGPQSLKLKWGEGLIRPQTSRGTRFSEFLCCRSICIYSGPSHTFKVQRLCEATDYQFSIQAHSEAGMGPLSPSYTFSTTRSPPPQLKAPKVELIERNKYAVTWEAHQPMKGDLIVYKLQMLRGREVEQLYKGPVTSYTWHNTSAGVACRLRVYAGRRSQDGSELWGQCSLSTGLPATEPPREHRISSCHEPQPRRSWPLTDEPFATVLLLGFVVLAVLFAVLIQYFVIERE